MNKIKQWFVMTINTIKNKFKTYSWLDETSHIPTENEILNKKVDKLREDFEELKECFMSNLHI